MPFVHFAHPAIDTPVKFAFAHIGSLLWSHPLLDEKENAARVQGGRATKPNERAACRVDEARRKTATTRGTGLTLIVVEAIQMLVWVFPG